MIAVQTERVILRQWRPEDRPLFAAINADAQVMKYFPSTLSKAQSDALVDRVSNDISVSGWGFWAAERVDTAEFIGFVGINYSADGLPFAPCVDIGWRLGSQHWGQGFATEAAHGAMAFAFTHANVEKLVSMTSLANTASERVMQKLGMIKLPKTFLHPKIAQGHLLQEHVLYELSRDQWRGKGAHNSKIAINSKVNWGEI
jgi:RimJ/RimL family protein N-acetyltransferase